MNATGLTDASLTFLKEAEMPKLKKLNIVGNKFTDAMKPSINDLRMNHIQVSYRTQVEREKDRKEREKEKEKEEIKNKENNKNKIKEENKALGDYYYLLKKFKNNTLNKYLNY